MTALVDLTVGSPQFRIKESSSEKAPLYKVYSQIDLSDDLTGIESEFQENRTIRTMDAVTTLNEKDIIFSLVSGKASLVQKNHEGYLYTQNYVVIKNEAKIDAGFLVYLLNEDKSIAHRFRMGLQGSMVLKYTVKQLRELTLPKLPAIARQQAIGKAYLKQLHLQALRERVAKNETIMRLAQLEGDHIHE